MLLSPGQKVRNNDMHLLDMVSFTQHSRDVTASGLTVIVVPQAQYYVNFLYPDYFNYHSVASFRNT